MPEVETVSSELEIAREREDLKDKLNRLVESADPEVLTFLTDLVTVTENNGNTSGDPIETPACFIGGLVSEEGARMRALQQDPCVNALRKLYGKSRIEAKHWARETGLLELVVGE